MLSLVEIGRVVLEKILKFCQCIFALLWFHSPCKWVGFFICLNLNSLHPRILYAKFCWNWPSSSEEDFKISSMYFQYFLIISPWIKAGPFIWTNFNPLPKGCFVPSLVKIGSVVQEKKIFKFCQCIFAISWLTSLGKGCGWWHWPSL